jgi:hypothetical protein
VRYRLLIVLGLFVVLDAAGIGLLLSRQGALPGDEALRQCQGQDPGARTSQEIGDCVRSKTYPRSTGRSAAVVAVPLVLGGTAVVSVALVIKRTPRLLRCPHCEEDNPEEASACAHCGQPLR